MAAYLIVFDFNHPDSIKRLERAVSTCCSSYLPLFEDRAWFVSFSGDQEELEEMLTPCHECLVDKVYISRADDAAKIQGGPNVQDAYKKWINTQR